nr:unnamed protein product [Digitaria exilis]
MQRAGKREGPSFDSPFPPRLRSVGYVASTPWQHAWHSPSASGVHTHGDTYEGDPGKSATRSSPPVARSPHDVSGVGPPASRPGYYAAQDGVGAPCRPVSAPAAAFVVF